MNDNEALNEMPLSTSTEQNDGTSEDESNDDPYLIMTF
jgi:hypothetical protein